MVEIDASDKKTASNIKGPPETRWHVLQTRSRQEKALARTLDAAGIEHYLPLTKRPRYRRDRKRFVEEPLFASYLFLHGPVEVTYLAVATERVANVIAVANQSRFIDELEQIRRALDNGADLSPFRYLKAGRRARVSAGPFRGIEGLIEAWRTLTGLCFRLAPWGAAQAWKSTPASSNRWTRTSRGGSASSPSAHVFAQLGTAGCARRGRSLPLFDA